MWICIISLTFKVEKTKVFIFVKIAGCHQRIRQIVKIVRYSFGGRDLDSSNPKIAYIKNRLIIILSRATTIHNIFNVESADTFCPPRSMHYPEYDQRTGKLIYAK